MTNVTNLGRHRKIKARDKKRAEADENAVKFGRSKAQKSLEARRKEKAARDLDGKKRD